MYNIKRIFIVIAVIVGIVVVAGSFVGEGVTDRAIIIGLGIDGSAEGVRVTAEVISPSTGEQVGAFSKVVSANGKTVATAIQRIAEITGKEASLGRCLLLVFGQQYFEQRDLSDDIEFFISSDSFKEGCNICCCEGDAEELFYKGAAFSQGVSLNLSSMFSSQSKQTAIVTNTLLDYTLSQQNMLKTGFMNKVRFVPSDNQSQDEPDKPQGFFDLKNIVIFAENKYLCELTDEENRGFALLSDEVIGSSFVSDADDVAQTVTVSTKDVSLKLSGDNSVKCEVNLLGKVVRTDSADIEGIFVAQKNKELSQAVIDDVVNQATEFINALLEKQRQYNFDIVNLHETIRRRDGSSERLDNLSTEDIKVELSVKLDEK